MKTGNMPAAILTSLKIQPPINPINNISSYIKQPTLLPASDSRMKMKRCNITISASESLNDIIQ